MAQAVEKLEHKVVEFPIAEYKHIEEDAGNAEARSSWYVHEPPWKRVKIARCLWRPKGELCVGAPWRDWRKKKDPPPVAPSQEEKITPVEEPISHPLPSPLPG